MGTIKPGIRVQATGATQGPGSQPQPGHGLWFLLWFPCSRVGTSVCGAPAPASVGPKQTSLIKAQALTAGAVVRRVPTPKRGNDQTRHQSAGSRGHTRARVATTAWARPVVLANGSHAPAWDPLSVALLRRPAWAPSKRR